MSKNSLELKDFVNDPTFIENMNRAFSDKEKEIEDLKKAAYYINRKIKQLEK